MKCFVIHKKYQLFFFIQVHFASVSVLIILIEKTLLLMLLVQKIKSSFKNHSRDVGYTQFLNPRF